MLLALCFGAALVAAPSAVAAPSVTAAKGPVGWQTYRALDGMAALRPGEQAKQFSSFDRTGGNDDGFVGTYSCLRNEPDGRCVIADAHGAGEISSIWFTYAADSVTAIGDITIELDGRVVLQGSLQEIVNGTRGAPFVWPLVGNSTDTMGGTVIKVPMPYTSSMRILTQNNPHFYHVNYRQFADAEGVRTFDPTDRAEDVIAKLRGYGVRDPKPTPAGAATQQSGVELAPGASMSLPVTAGPRWISQLRMRLPQVVTSPGVYDDGRAFRPGGSSFTVAVDPRNEGVRLTKRYDLGIRNQRAGLSVDGTPVGEWNSGNTGDWGQWAEQAIEVPQTVTGGKSRLSVANSFLSSDLDVNEFRYEVHSRLNGQWVRTDILDLGPNHPNEEAAHGYRISAQNWEGLRSYRYPSDPAQVSTSDSILENLRLRITFDGLTTVEAPVGEFFGSGLGKHEARTLMHSIDVTPDGAFTSWWPMPFARDAVVELVNAGTVPVTRGSLEVTSAADPALPAKLADGGGLGYFNATYHRGDPVMGQEWNFLFAQGKGVFYGVSASMRGHRQGSLNYLEGDERGYADGSRTPEVNGTGSEDFYESGWYFKDAQENRDGVPYAMPQAGLVSHESGADGCQNECLGTYRLMLADAVAFGNGLEFDIEHGPNSDEPATYSSVAYWYGQRTPSLRQSDLVDVTNADSRAIHGYTATGETTGTLQSTFEGKGDTTPVTAGTTAVTGQVSFTATVDRANDGLRLRRMSDQAQGMQRANVYIDNRLVGEWYQPLHNTHSRWLEDAFDVPSWATAGKPAVNVRLEPISGAPAWSASRYTVFSQAGPAAPPAD